MENQPDEIQEEKPTVKKCSKCKKPKEIDLF